MVLGILAILGSLIPGVNIVSILLGLIGLVVGAIALSKIKKGTAAGRGMALTGVITSMLAIIISVVVLFFVAIALRQHHRELHRPEPHARRGQLLRRGPAHQLSPGARTGRHPSG